MLRKTQGERGRLLMMVMVVHRGKERKRNMEASWMVGLCLKMGMGAMNMTLLLLLQVRRWRWTATAKQR